MKNTKRILSVTIKKMYDESPDTSWLGEYSDNPTSDYSIDRAHDEFVGDIESGQNWLERIKERLIDAQDMEHPDHCPNCGEFAETEEKMMYCPSDSCDWHAPYNPDWMYALENALETVTDLLAEFEVDWDRREARYFNPSFNYVNSKGEPNNGETPETVRLYTRQDYKRMEALNRGDWCSIGIRAEAEIGIPFMTAQGPRDHFTIQRITSGGLWGIESDSDDSYFAEVESDELANLKEQLLALGFGKRAIAAAFKNVERKEAY